MKVIITHYLKDGKNTMYDENRKPVKGESVVDFPLRFGYGSYNEPRKLLDKDINVDDIIEIREYKQEYAMQA
jgi:hypothetical protein